MISYFYHLAFPSPHHPDPPMAMLMNMNISLIFQSSYDKTMPTVDNRLQYTDLVGL